MKSWGIHACALNRECRAMTTCPKTRVTVGTPWGVLLLAILPGDWAQLWSPRTGYTRRFGPIAWHPRHRERDSP